LKGDKETVLVRI